MARNTVVNNDSLFSHISEEEKDRRNDIKKYSQFSFWNSLTIKDGFKIQLKLVIPDFWNSEMESMSKKKLLEKLKKYLEMVHKKVDLNNDDTCDEIDLLSKFIKPSDYLSNKRLARKRCIDAIKTISEQHGTVIVQRKRCRK